MTMPATIAVRWEEASIRGYIDLLPSRILSGRMTGSIIEHEVQGPRGGHYGIAKCKIAVRSRQVDLDYGVFKDFNTNSRMELGVMRLRFADTKRRVLQRIEWCNTGATRFVTAEARVVDGPVISAQSRYEGAIRRIHSNAFVRDPRLRIQCIAHYGSTCFACGFDFEKIYGAIAAGFIHVHHLNHLAQRGGRHRVDPVKDLRPLCPNCHAVVHLEPKIGIVQLRAMLKGRS